MGAAADCSRKLSYRQPFVFYALIHRNRIIITDRTAGVNDTAQITLIELYGHATWKKKKIYIVVSHHPLRLLIRLDKSNYNKCIFTSKRFYRKKSKHYLSALYKLPDEICNLIILIKSFNKFKINIRGARLTDDLCHIFRSGRVIFWL